MKKFKFNEHQIFSIRKISLGVVSVLLGSVFAITSQISQVKANVINTTLSSTDTLNKDEAYNSYVFSGSDNLRIIRTTLRLNFSIKLEMVKIGIIAN